MDAAEWEVDVDAKGHEIKNFKFQMKNSKCAPKGDHSSFFICNLKFEISPSFIIA